jgi:hypothetical protein
LDLLIGFKRVHTLETEWLVSLMGWMSASNMNSSQSGHQVARSGRSTSYAFVMVGRQTNPSMTSMQLVVRSA